MKEQRITREQREKKKLAAKIGVLLNATAIGIPAGVLVNGLIYYFVNRDDERTAAFFMIFCAVTCLITSAISSVVTSMHVETEIQLGEIPIDTYRKDQHLLINFFPTNKVLQIILTCLIVGVHFLFVSSGAALIIFEGYEIPVVTGALLNGVFSGLAAICAAYFMMVATCANLEKKYRRTETDVKVRKKPREIEGERRKAQLEKAAKKGAFDEFLLDPDAKEEDDIDELQEKVSTAHELPELDSQAEAIGDNDSKPQENAATASENEEDAEEKKNDLSEEKDEVSASDDEPKKAEDKKSAEDLPRRSASVPSRTRMSGATMKMKMEGLGELDEDDDEPVKEKEEKTIRRSGVTYAKPEFTMKTAPAPRKKAEKPNLRMDEFDTFDDLDDEVQMEEDLSALKRGSGKKTSPVKKSASASEKPAAKKKASRTAEEDEAKKPSIRSAMKKTLFDFDDDDEDELEPDDMVGFNLGGFDDDDEDEKPVRRSSRKTEKPARKPAGKSAKSGGFAAMLKEALSFDEDDDEDLDNLSDEELLQDLEEEQESKPVRAKKEKKEKPARKSIFSFDDDDDLDDDLDDDDLDDDDDMDDLDLDDEDEKPARRSAKPARNTKPERSARPEKNSRPARGNKPEKSPKPEKKEKPARKSLFAFDDDLDLDDDDDDLDGFPFDDEEEKPARRSKKPAKTEKPAKSAKPARSSKPARSEKPAKTDQPEKASRWSLDRILPDEELDDSLFEDEVPVYGKDAKTGVLPDMSALGLDYEDFDDLDDLL